jgi:hypothetical protein
MKFKTIKEALFEASFVYFKIDYRFNDDAHGE